jgi:hypothetical protein
VLVYSRAGLFQGRFIPGQVYSRAGLRRVAVLLECGGVGLKVYYSLKAKRPSRARGNDWE